MIRNASLAIIGGLEAREPRGRERLGASSEPTGGRSGEWILGVMLRWGA